MARRQRGEGSLFQRASDGRWVGRIDLGWSGGRRRQKTVYGRTQAEARRKLAEARRAVEAGDRTTAGQTLDRWLSTWLEEICPGKGVRPRTLANYRSYARNYLGPALGRVRLDRLTPRHVRELHRFVLDRGLSSTTAGHAHKILATALTDAVREGVLVRSPTDLVPQPRSAPSTRRALTVDEAGRVLAAQGPAGRLAARWMAALLLGMRPGECLGLTWECVDLSVGTIDIAWQLQRIPYRHGCQNLAGDPIPGHRAHQCGLRTLATLPGFEYRHLTGNLVLQRPKTRSRVVPIPVQMNVALVHRWHEYQRERDGYTTDHGLVWCMPDGRPIEPAEDREWWHDMLRLANVDDAELYSARHTTATLLLALGVPEDIRMSILGHTVAQTTRGYTHVDLSMQRQAVAALGARLAIDTGRGTTTEAST